MKKQSFKFKLSILIISLIVVGTISLFSSTSKAYSRRTQLYLGRHFVNENGFTITDDHVAQSIVLKRRSSIGEITSGIIRAYSRDTVTRRHLIRSDRRYISFLNPWGARPRFWREDSTVPWSTRRQTWLEIYRRAGRILRNEIISPCEAPPDHWYSRPRTRMERRLLARRAQQEGYTEVDCGTTLNTYWKRI